VSSGGEQLRRPLYLIPLSEFRNEITFFEPQLDKYRICIDREGKFCDTTTTDPTDSNGKTTASSGCYELGLAEEEDLPDLARFIVRAFGADAIRLSSIEDLSAFERALLQPATKVVNGYSAIVAFAEVLAGLRSRLASRLSKGLKPISKYIEKPRLDPNLSREQKLDAAASSSVVLILAKKHSTGDKNTTSEDWHSDIIGSVELRLQPADAKIPFSWPWLDRIERRLGSWVGAVGKNDARDLQPYLSNLCVDEAFRSRGIGRALVRAVENIASTNWKYRRMYLHVDLDDDKGALELYKSEGYRDVGFRWNPFWAGKASEIGYFVKTMDVNNGNGDNDQTEKKPKKKRHTQKDGENKDPAKEQRQ